MAVSGGRETPVTMQRSVAWALAAGLLLAACAGESAPPGGSSTSDSAAPTTGAVGRDRDSPARPSTDTVRSTVVGPPTVEGPPTLEALPAGRELHLRAADGRVETIYTLDPWGESVFVSAAVRPGSTADEATVVTITQAEGTYDLRWIEISAAVPGELHLFDVPYRPTSGMTPIDEAGPTVAWAPDGGSIGWIEWSAGGETTLRTVGWGDGPGTGDTATDNAAFGVEPIPAGARIRAWRATGASTSRIDVAGPDGGAWSITVERQGDGALALPPNAVREGVRD